MSGDVTTWLQSLGLAVKEAVLDGAFHRVDGKKKGRKAGWYKGWESPVRCCVAGDWSTSDKWLWTEQHASQTDLRKARKLQKEAVAGAEAERLRQHEAVAAAVREKLSAAAPADPAHPYLAVKRIGANGAMMLGDILLVPNFDVSGLVWGAQRITPDGDKFWHKGQRVAETFFQIGGLRERAFLCEGFATGATIHEATGDAVFCAFSANNLKKTGLALHRKHPSVSWVVAGDDDFETKNNPGRGDAIGAAEAMKAHVVFPEFPEGTRGTDFNDLMLLHGMEVVTRQLQRTHKPMADVISINRNQSSADDDKLTRAELFRAIIKKMNRESDGPDWPEFPERFHVVRDDLGRTAVLEELRDGIVALRSEEVVGSAIINYCWHRIPFVPEAKIDADVVGKCLRTWLSMTPRLPAPPAPFLEKSQTGLTFNRLNFDLPPGWPGVEPPLFEEILSRCSQPMALCGFIGSLFFPESDRQQYLYIFGNGADSKGALMRVLHDVFGNAAVALDPPAKDNARFWNSRVYGKRLGLFFDCSDWKWFGSPQFKSMTGSDPVYFEFKGEGGFSDYPTTKFIAASNSKPRISSQKADLRRLIFVKMRPAPGEQDPTYGARLKLETESIIRTCKEIYLQQCPNHGPVPFEAAHEVALENEATYLDIFFHNFVLDPKHVLSGEEVRRVLYDAGVRDKQEIRDVKECWERQIEGLAIDPSKKGTRYIGVRKKEAFEHGQ